MPSSAPSAYLHYSEERYASILPPVAEIERYEALVPGVAARIVAQFEQQGAHRRDLERQDLEASIRQAKWGLWSALLIALTAIVGGVILGLGGDGGYGVTLSGIGVATIVGTFVWGTKRQNEQMVLKAKIMRGDPLD